MAEPPITEVADVSTFAELGVPEPMIRALAALGVQTPFPIQTVTIPDGLRGRDVLGRGKTGSGKTVAFAVPVVAALLDPSYRTVPTRPGALILVPTRELATQVARTVRPLAEAMGRRCAVVHGGVSMAPQTTALRRGVDIVVATPGRLEDLIARGQCRLDTVRVTVLDEADHLADLGFLPAVKRILEQTPSQGQRLLFSATLDNVVAQIVDRYLRDPAVRAVDPPEATPTRLEHHIFHVQASQKSAIVTELASGQGRSLLFTRTKHGAKKLATQLNNAGIPTVELHGNLAQAARDRNLAAFSAGSSRVLVATDIAARGIHVDDIALVVHVDPPAEHKAFLHRSGRTARAGALGVVVTVVTPDQVRDVGTLVRRAGIQARTLDVTPGHRQTLELTGPPAARVERPATPPAGAAPTAAAPSRPRPAGNNAMGGRRPQRPGTPRRSGARAAAGPRRGHNG